MFADKQHGATRLFPLQNIDPHLLLAVFLPVLLFASAFVAHWHTVRRQKVPILLLVRAKTRVVVISFSGVATNHCHAHQCSWNTRATPAAMRKLLLAALQPERGIVVFLQAFPGVLIGMGGIAVLMRYSFPYNWSWTQSLLFGAMMAATDPVATIAVLGNVSSACCSTQHVTAG